MTQLTELNKISIAIICFYTPALIIAILLCVRHGFGRSSGWFFLCLLSIIRLLSGAMQLATISNPTNLSLILGSATLQSVAVSPLILVMLGLLTRVVGSISHNSSPFVTPRNLRLVQLLVLVGLILGIVGGTQLAGSIANKESGASAPPSGGVSHTLPTESVAGLALTIAGYGLLIIATAVTATQLGSVDSGEKRLLLAVALAQPFVLVRIVFAGLGIFGTNPAFKTFGGSPDYPNYFLGMAVVMEMVAVVIFEAVGLTLQRVPRGTLAPKQQGVPMVPYGQRREQQREQRLEEGRY